MSRQLAATADGPLSPRRSAVVAAAAVPTESFASDVDAPSTTTPSRPPPPGGVTWNTRSLDWSGETDLGDAYALLLEAGAAAAAAGGRVRVAADLDPSSAVGLWLAVKLPEGEQQQASVEAEADTQPSPPAFPAPTLAPDADDPRAPALYLTVTPLDEATATAPGAPSPFARAPFGTRFRPADEPRPGGWLNYRVTLLGGVAPDADEALWPNMVLHGDRAMHNVRDAGDVVAFLAVATRSDVVSHALNLKALADLRGRGASWCWDLLAQRWGAEDLKAMGVGLTMFDGLAVEEARKAARRRGEGG